jgi:hypothetical protein
VFPARCVAFRAAVLAAATPATAPVIFRNFLREREFMLTARGECMIDDCLFQSFAIRSVPVNGTGVAERGAAERWTGIDHPAGCFAVGECRARVSNVGWALLNGPAGNQREQAPDTGDAHLLGIDRFAKAPDSLQVRMRIQAVPGRLSHWQNESLPLVKAKGRHRNAKDVGCFADTID